MSNNILKEETLEQMRNIVGIESAKMMMEALAFTSPPVALTAEAITLAARLQIVCDVIGVKPEDVLVVAEHFSKALMGGMQLSEREKIGQANSGAVSRLLMQEIEKAMTKGGGN